MNETNDKSGEGTEQERPSDIESITITESGTAYITTNLFSGELDDLHDGVEFGFQVHQDGSYIAVSSGTTWSPEGSPELSTYLGFTPEQAREAADALNEAADKAEACMEESGAETDADGESLIRRLLP